MYVYIVVIIIKVYGRCLFRGFDLFFEGFIVIFIFIIGIDFFKRLCCEKKKLKYM